MDFIFTSFIPIKTLTPGYATAIRLLSRCHTTGLRLAAGRGLQMDKLSTGLCFLFPRERLGMQTLPISEKRASGVMLLVAEPLEVC